MKSWFLRPYLRLFSLSYFSGLSFFLVLFLGCDSVEEPASMRQVSPNQLIELNHLNVLKQRALIDSVVFFRGWIESPGFKENASGIRLLSAEAFEQAKPIKQGDTLSWLGKAMLLDSTVLFDWNEAEPFSIIVDASNWPLGFHELAKEMRYCNALSAIVPSHLGWGLTGLSGAVPPDAVIWMELDFFSLRPKKSEIDFKYAPDSWDAFIDAFESESFRADSAWLKRPKLLASPCVAWGDEDSKRAAFVTGTPVSISVRTFQSGQNPKSHVDLGWNQWEFRMGDDQQVLPLFEALISQNPKYSKWECHCPVDMVFGTEGIPSAGLLPGHVVGFQWELSPMTMDNI
tara:strand:- start:5244 stop:6275 length:1032 start_codon:yes stop_codon:yes gene_type:complete